MTQYLKDRLLLKSIDVHKKIMNGATSEDLVSFGFEKDAPIDRIYLHNQFTVISSLDFNFEESTNPESLHLMI
ncbi:hypothetical protein [Aquibacillus albus]|uniref:Uncharacterized protein n=1 Tax=Aquibacillus albus TaxID=1168171 RepID=A0ABS2N445_9BACI|nr:hypothetical protein [Aquibacillus albus]MBM7572917.1 hypothetical protein [Aquibacillus albus]